MQTKLSVNINKVALLRNARGENIPNLLQFALNCQRYGADGVTVHPRPDERHITRADVNTLAEHFPNEHCEFNIEGYPSRDFIDMVCRVKPTQCTLVPDKPGQLTSDHGWNTIKYKSLLNDVIAELKQNNIRVSLFIDPVANLIEGAANVGAHRIEYYTGPFAKHPETEIEIIKASLHVANQNNLGINAGHDLNLNNLHVLKAGIPNLLEVSIGQALVRDCLYFGLENTIGLYKRKLSDVQ